MAQTNKDLLREILAELKEISRKVNTVFPPTPLPQPQTPPWEPCKDQIPIWPRETTVVD